MPFRFLLPVAAGLWAIGLSLLARRLELTSVPDFVVFWTAGHALVHGIDPYRAVAALDNGYPFFYPFPAAIVMAPFGLFPWPVALPLFMGVSGALLGWASLRYGRGLAAALLSAAFINAVVEGQWSPLLTASAVLPVLGALLVVKPSIGLALWAFRPSRLAVAGGLVLLALSVVIQPGWPAVWVDSLGASNHVSPILRPGGFVLLLALLKWRTAEGRLLAVLSSVPHTTSLFETLPLFLIPRSRAQGYALAALSFAGLVIKEYTLRGDTLEQRIASGWPSLFLCLWLPALVMVLWFQPAPDRDQEPARSPNS